MTKWHKYRDIKPNIKSIIKSKENSRDIVSEIKVKTHSERLFLMLNNAEGSDEETLSAYKEFSKLHKSVWIAIHLSEENMTLNSITTTDGKIKVLNEAIQNGELVWMYLATSKKLLESDEIECKVKVIEVTYSEIDKASPDVRFTLKNHQDDKSKLWVKVSEIKKCGGVSTKDLTFLASDVNLKEDIVTLNFNFGFVERISKHVFKKNTK